MTRPCQRNVTQETKKTGEIQKKLMLVPRVVHKARTPYSRAYCAVPSRVQDYLTKSRKALEVS
jgi:hypothetical protein